MFQIRKARAEDSAGAMGALAEAFDEDPLVHYLFAESADGVRDGLTRFFSILYKVRLALEMPAFVLEYRGHTAGLSMGYDTSRPDWPEEIKKEWDDFATLVPGFGERLSAYEEICEAYEPQEDHYYLGVLGVRPSQQGIGAGKALINHFCALSRDDPKSHGVYLETASQDSLTFYRSNGFEILGEGKLDAMPLWCVYRRT